MNFDLKIAVKMNLRIITKCLAADPEIGFLTISISKPDAHATVMTTALELIKLNLYELTGTKFYHIYLFSITSKV